MIRKDFRVLAAILRQYTKEAEVQNMSISAAYFNKCFATQLSKHYPNFDQDKFLNAIYGEN